MIFNTEPQDWKELQKFVGQMFEECGFQTEITKSIDLVRGKKEIDVYAQDISSEYKPILLVECKFWNKAVNQGIIHSFRTVVADFGANLGFIVSKNGFQSGSYDAAKNTNVRLVSLKDLEKEYCSKWKQGMVKKYVKYADELFPYWDPAGGKKAKDGEIISWETQQLVYAAYEPICGLGTDDFMLGDFERKYPINVPILNDELKTIGEKEILND
ncbi:MAG: restriction endonuclease, partial [Candidatus Pacebacteria bacterium]|nr:restriction endonuclease [Candidatus Paceibacterota bacterium]